MSWTTEMGWTRRHLLDVEDLRPAETRVLLDRAEKMRRSLEGTGDPLEDDLCSARVALLFAEPSTRTRMSFEIAARNLAAETLVMDPLASSLVKGETLTDTVRVLGAMGVDMLVLRHHRSGAPWVAARYFDGSVVNAGDGWHAHPTQALVDLFTLRRAWSADSLRGRKVVIVGDLLHSRVARSNIWTLTADGADVWLCGPRTLLRGFEELARALPGGRHLTVTDDLAAALRDAEAVMALRIQRERMSGAALSLADYVSAYRIDETRMGLALPDAWFLHPGPVNEGVEVTRSVAAGPRSLVLEQVRNGVPIRMAVLALLAEAASAAVAPQVPALRRPASARASVGSAARPPRDRRFDPA
jgi:aspartate carbamoyltransferase catalytic subunit